MENIRIGNANATESQIIAAAHAVRRKQPNMSKKGNFICRNPKKGNFRLVWKDKISEWKVLRFIFLFILFLELFFWEYVSYLGRCVHFRNGGTAKRFVDSFRRNNEYRNKKNSEKFQKMKNSLKKLSFFPFLVVFPFFLLILLYFLFW